MTTRRRSTAIALVAVSGVLLAGCTADAESEGAADGTVTISGWHWLEPTRGETLWQVFEDIDASLEDITVEQVPIAYGDTMSTLTTQLGGGSGPDIVSMVEPMFATLVEADLIEPLDELLPPEEIEGLAEANSVAEVDGVQYGYLDETTHYGLIYNQRLLDEAGVSVPTTWEELEAAALAVTEQTGEYGFSTRTQSTDPAGMYNDFLNWALGFGGGYAEDGELTLDRPENVEALTAIETLYEAGVMPEQTSISENRQLFVEGKVAMMLESNGTFATLLQTMLETDPSMEGEAGIAPSPLPTKETIPINIIFGINAASENKEAAAAVLREFLTEPVQQDWTHALAGSTGPLGLETPQELLDENPWMADGQALEEHTTSQMAPGFESKTGQISTAVADAVQAVLVNGEDPQAALERAQEEAEALLE